MKPLRALLVLLFVLAAPVQARGQTPGQAPGQAQENLRLAERSIKVGLIYNFLHYTNWPPAPSPTRPFDVCVFGEDPFDGRLALMANRTVNQRPIRLHAIATADEARGCSLVFVTVGRRRDWPAIRAALTHRSVLTVSDFDGFAETGGMIEFTRVRERVGVRINTDALSASGLSVEARLLRLAEASGDAR